MDFLRELTPVLDARKSAVGKHEVSVEQEGGSLKFGNTTRDVSDSAASAEEVIEERGLDPILMHKEKQLIDVGAVNHCRIVSEDPRQPLLVDLVGPFDR